MYGAIKPPTLATMEQVPSAVFLTAVGNISALYKYIKENAADDPIFPTQERTLIKTGIDVGTNPAPIHAQPATS